jgi:hypothetical protein
MTAIYGIDFWFPVKKQILDFKECIYIQTFGPSSFQEICILDIETVFKYKKP